MLRFLRITKNYNPGQIDVEKLELMRKHLGEGKSLDYKQKELLVQTNNVIGKLLDFQKIYFFKFLQGWNFGSINKFKVPAL